MGSSLIVMLTVGHILGSGWVVIFGYDDGDGDGLIGGSLVRSQKVDEVLG